MEEEQVQVKLQVYADFVKTKRALKRFNKLLALKQKKHAELSERYGMYEKMDAEAKEKCVENEKENVLQGVKQVEKEIARCLRNIRNKEKKAQQLTEQL